MGNSNTAAVNQLTVTLSFEQFGIESLPAKPSIWAQRIDDKTWTELRQCCKNAADVPHLAQRRADFDKLKKRQIRAHWTVFLCFVCCLVMGLSGTIGEIAGLAITSIVLAALVILPGLYVWFTSWLKKMDVLSVFIAEVRNNLKREIAALNEKYRSKMRLSIIPGGVDYISLTNKNDDDRIITIDISVQLQVDSVEYIAASKPQTAAGSTIQGPSTDETVSVQTVQVEGVADVPYEPMVQQNHEQQHIEKANEENPEI